MEKVFRNGAYTLTLKGAKIIADISGRNAYKAGIISILPGVQIIIGDTYSNFMAALRESRQPVAIRFGGERNNVSIYSVYRLGTGDIGRVVMGNLTVYAGIISYYVFNADLLRDKGFKRDVGLSNTHQLYVRSTPSQIERDAYIATRKLLGSAKDIISVRTWRGETNVFLKSTNDFGLPVIYSYSSSDNRLYKLYGIGLSIKELHEAYTRRQVR